MLIPFLMLVLFIFVFLLVLGLVKKSKVLLTLLVIFWWLCSFFSFYFVMVAWNERHYSENWAMIGVIFFSLPINIFIGIMSIVLLLFSKIRKIENFKGIAISLWLLLLFVILQGALGFLAGMK